jgi:hypothetical protein
LQDNLKVEVALNNQHKKRSENFANTTRVIRSRAKTLEGVGEIRQFAVLRTRQGIRIEPLPGQNKPKTGVL